MDELIIKKLSGNATDIEGHQLDRWREAAPENEVAYREVESVWDLAEVLDDRDEVGAAPPVERVVQEAEARRRRARGQAGRRALLRSPWMGYGLAAAAVAALLFMRGLDDATPGVAPFLSPVESTSSATDVVTMALSDGSLIRLSESTTVEFPPVADRREVLLSGRAFFAVAHAAEPFVVRTPGGVVTVTGTRFEVSSAADGLRLIVVEGTVVLEGNGGVVEVAAGQVARVRGGDAPAVISASDVWSLLDWADGLLVFQETPLADVASEIARHFATDVSVAEGLADRRITAWFGDESMDEVVAAVCLVAGAECEVGREGVAIGR